MPVSAPADPTPAMNPSTRPELALSTCDMFSSRCSGAQRWKPIEPKIVRPISCQTSVTAE